MPINSLEISICLFGRIVPMTICVNSFQVQIDCRFDCMYFVSLSLHNFVPKTKNKIDSAPKQRNVFNFILYHCKLLHVCCMACSTKPLPVGWLALCAHVYRLAYFYWMPRNLLALYFIIHTSHNVHHTHKYWISSGFSIRCLCIVRSLFAFHTGRVLF